MNVVEEAVLQAITEFGRSAPNVKDVDAKSNQHVMAVKVSVFNAFLLLKMLLFHKALKIGRRFVCLSLGMHLIATVPHQAIYC